MIVGGTRELTEKRERENAGLLRDVPSYEWEERVASPYEAAEKGLGRRRTDVRIAK